MPAGAGSAVAKRGTSEESPCYLIKEGKGPMLDARFYKKCTENSSFFGVEMTISQ